MQPSSASLQKRKWPVRLAWLVVIWACSVGALGLAAWLMKMAMRAGGLVT
jgi:hypothetical protein